MEQDNLNNVFWKVIDSIAKDDELRGAIYDLNMGNKMTNPMAFVKAFVPSTPIPTSNSTKPSQTPNLSTLNPATASYYGTYDIEEYSGCYYLRFDAPGAYKSNIKINVLQHISGYALNVDIERKVNKKCPDTVLGHVMNRFSGTKKVEVKLPTDADPTKVSASYDNGVLTVTVQKKKNTEFTPINVPLY